MAWATVPAMSELCPGDHAYTYLRGLGLAHMDAHLRDVEAAAELLAEDLALALKQRGIAVQVVE